MSPTSSASSTPQSASSSSTSGATQTTDLANEQTFLKLLVAQIQHQDPLNPMDGTQFVTQLAQYSSLEQLIGIKQDADTLTKATSTTGTSSSGTTTTTKA